MVLIIVSAVCGPSDTIIEHYCVSGTCWDMENEEGTWSLTSKQSSKGKKQTQRSVRNTIRSFVKLHRCCHGNTRDEKVTQDGCPENTGLSLQG